MSNAESAAIMEMTKEFQDKAKANLYNTFGYATAAKSALANAITPLQNSFSIDCFRKGFDALIAQYEAEGAPQDVLVILQTTASLVSNADIVKFQTAAAALIT